MRRVTYYRDAQAEVRDDFFIRYTGDGGRSFAIGELRQPRAETQRRGWRRRTVHRLTAVYRGSPVLLFETGNERVFNMVRRALQRALEQRPPGGSPPGSRPPW